MPLLFNKQYFWNEILFYTIKHYYTLFSIIKIYDFITKFFYCEIVSSVRDNNGKLRPLSTRPASGFSLQKTHCSIT